MKSGLSYLVVLGFSMCCSVDVALSQTPPRPLDPVELSVTLPPPPPPGAVKQKTCTYSIEFVECSYADGRCWGGAKVAGEFCSDGTGGTVGAPSVLFLDLGEGRDQGECYDRCANAQNKRESFVEFFRLFEKLNGLR